MHNVLPIAMVTLPLIAQAIYLPNEALAASPPCAQPCLRSLVANLACSPTDQICTCEGLLLEQKVTACIVNNCTAKETIETLNLVSTSCGVPIRDKSAGFIIVCGILLAFSVILVMQRFAYKHGAKLEYGLDDCFTLASAFITLAMAVLSIYGFGQNGLGCDIWTLTDDQITNFGKFFYTIETIYFLDMSLLKLALIFFYIRIFPGTYVRMLLWGTAIFVSLFGVSFIATAIFQCSPISFNWEMWSGEQKGTCLDTNILAWCNAGISIALGIWLLAIPLWQLRKLQLDWRKKLGVSLMFFLGTFVTVVSILRLQALKSSTGSFNFTWDLFDVGLWSTVEVNIGVICVCLPSLRLLLVRLYPKLSGSAKRQSAYYTNSEYHSGATGVRQMFGTGTLSNVRHSRRGEDESSNRIMCYKSFAVDFHDETALVQMCDLHLKNTKLGSSYAVETEW